MTKPAIPIDPITGILESFESHDVVALCDGGHGCEQAYDLRVALIRDPRFANLVNDIVVESGNALYQEMMDRFIAGEDIPEHELRQAWQNTTQPHDVWDRPVFEGFFRAVREVNASLPEERRIRVLLGDPPIDWSTIHSAEELRACEAMAQRNSCPVDIIEREVLARHRRALVIYGAMHFLRKTPYWQMKDQTESERRFNAPANSIVSVLEDKGVNVYSIWSTVLIELAELHPDASSWPIPSFVPLRDTPLGTMSFRSYYPHAMITLHGGVPEEIHVDPVRSHVMQEQFDAILYYGPQSALTWSEVSPALASDPEYVRMRAERMAWLGFP